MSNGYGKEEYGHIAGQYSCPTAKKTEELPAVPSPIPASEPNAQTCKNPSGATWRHFSFICSKDLVDKVQAIAHKEGFTIRTFMEYVMAQGISAYESKHGKVKKIKTKEIHEVM